MARREEISEQDVIAHLAGVAEAASLREMAQALDLRHVGRRELKKVIAKLKRHHLIEEVQSGRYALAGRKVQVARVPNVERAKGPSAAQQAAAREGGAVPKPPQPHSQALRPEVKRAGGTPAVRERRDANEVTGRIVVHRDGYGFVLPEEPVAGMEGDLFIGRDALGDAMHGDRVSARIERRGWRGGRGGRFEGRVTRILKREHPTVVGEFRYGVRLASGGHGNVVLPFDTRILNEIVIPPGDELTAQMREKLSAAATREGREQAESVSRTELDGAVVNVELTRFPRGAIPAMGRVVETLGRAGDIGVDTEIVIRKHHLQHEFPEEVLEEAAGVPHKVSEAAARVAGREDFRHLPIVTIDGETAKDFDDAVHVEKLANGHYELQVHIADVSHYVKRGGALDREARVRGTSVYFPNRALPMLPEALSNGICSLNPQVDRLVMSAVMEIDAHGKMLHARFTPGVIRSVERMTYTNVNKVLEGEPEMSARYRALAGRFRIMKELALILNAKRVRRGSIDFDLPEPVIEFDELGRMVKIIRSERNIAHRIIEEFMLAANEAVANYLEKRGIASLHRVHEKPDPKKVLEFEELAKAFGYTLGVADLAEKKLPVKHGKMQAPGRHGRMGGGRMRAMTVTLPATEISIRPQHYQALVRKIEGKPEERILSYLMLRSLKQARYTAEPLGHFALACDEYTHFTSPIRRYPDLVVHRILKWALENPKTKFPPTVAGRKAETHAGPASGTGATLAGLYRGVELEEIATESSEAERRADAAERELTDWKTAQFMEQHLGEEYTGLIISVHRFGFFVELLEVFVEGLVPIGAIEEYTGGGCFYRESDRAILVERARHGGRGRHAPGANVKAFRLGDRVRLRAERIDPFQNRVEFAIV